MKSIHVLRKPCSEPTVAANVLRHGTGGLDIGESRIACQPGDKGEWPITSRPTKSWAMAGPKAGVTTDHAQGRWPANLVLGACLDSELDGVFPHTKSAASITTKAGSDGSGRAFRVIRTEAMVVPGPGDSGSAARYFRRVSG